VQGNLPLTRNVGEVGARGRGKRKGEKKREEKKGEFHSQDSVVNCVPLSWTILIKRNTYYVLWCPTQ
jgi:hypothetical protein